MARLFSAYVLLFAAATVSVAGEASRAFAGSGDSLCIHVLSTTRAEHVTLEHGYALGGGLPATICNLEEGVRYRLILGGDRRERRIGTFSIGSQGLAVVHGIQVSAVSRNLLLPGWGSAYAGRGAAGLSDDMGIAASLVVLCQEEMEYRHMRDRLAILEERIAGARSYEDKERFQTAAHAASREVNVQNEYRRRLAIVAGGIYAWQVVEPFLADRPPGSSSGHGRGEITLRGAPESRPKAFLYSLVRPGRGQFYQGKTMRGVLFSLATVAGGLAVLHYQNEYDYAADDYEVCVERFNAETLVSEKERLRDEASRLWIDVENGKDRRNASLIVLAGVWGWNVLDTFFAGDVGGSGTQRYSFDIDARGASLAFRF